MNATLPSAEAGPSTLQPTNNEPHSMRIATQGNLKNYVAFALKFLTETFPPRPLLLHTLPPIPKSRQSVEPSSTSTSLSTDHPQQLQQPKQESTKPRHPITNTIPKLISVAEIIKREYAKLVVEQALAGPPSSAEPASDVLPSQSEESQVNETQTRKGKEKSEGEGGKKAKKAKAKGESRGIWQYNETGCVEDLSLAGEPGLEGWTRSKRVGGEEEGIEETEQALERLKHALGGKTGPTMVHTPYLKITLSTIPRPDLAASPHVSTQHISIPLPPPKKKTKSQLRRARHAAARAAGHLKPVKPFTADTPSTSISHSTPTPISKSADAPTPSTTDAGKGKTKAKEGKGTLAGKKNAGGRAGKGSKGAEPAGVAREVKKRPLPPPSESGSSQGQGGNAKKKRKVDPSLPSAASEPIASSA